jgi:hypothetical protein
MENGDEMSTVTQLKRQKDQSQPTGLSLPRMSDATAIKECARYVKGRIADTNAADAWIAVGKALAHLKGELLKTTPRGDNEHIGWQQAFDNGEFGFGRRHADRLITVYEFFSGRSTSSKNLPASSMALHLIATKMQLDEVSRRLNDGSICAATTEKEIGGMVKKVAAAPRAPRSPKPAPTDDEIAGTSLALLKLKERAGQINILLSLIGSLGIKQGDLF